MGAAAASILRDTSIGSLSSDMVQSSLSLYACTTERTSVVRTVGRRRSRKFIHRSEFHSWTDLSIHFDSAVSRVEQGGACPRSAVAVRGHRETEVDAAENC